MMDSLHVGRLIGKGGSNIRALQNELDVKICIFDKDEKKTLGQGRHVMRLGIAFWVTFRRVSNSEFRGWTWTVWAVHPCISMLSCLLGVVKVRVLGGFHDPLGTSPPLP